jgi:hypothetical protein
MHPPKAGSRTPSPQREIPTKRRDYRFKVFRHAQPSSTSDAKRGEHRPYVLATPSAVALARHGDGFRGCNSWRSRHHISRS